jgi:hypothetical protein
LEQKTRRRSVVVLRLHVEIRTDFRFTLVPTSVENLAPRIFLSGDEKKL